MKRKSLVESPGLFFAGRTEINTIKEARNLKKAGNEWSRRLQLHAGASV